MKIKKICSPTFEKLYIFVSILAFGLTVALVLITSAPEFVGYQMPRSPYEVIRYINDSKVFDLQFYVYHYVIKATQISRMEYWSVLWERLKQQHYEPDVVYSLPEVPSPCLIPEKIRIRYPSVTANASGMMVPLPALTLTPLGRLGNIMGEYATLFALGKLYNVRVFLHPDIDRILRRIFPHISMEPLPAGATETLSFTRVSKDAPFNYSPLELAAAGMLGPHFFKIEETPFQMHLFNAIQNEIFEEFKFSEEIYDRVIEFFRSIRSNSRGNATQLNSNSPTTFIGVHVRRTDYAHHLKVFSIKTHPGRTYVKRALEFYRKLFPNPVFIASSDDKDFLRDNFDSEKNFFITPDETPPEVDMAILSSCNHSIMSLGTYGFFSSYLAKGQAVFANVSTKYDNYQFSEKTFFDAGLKNFIPVKAD